MTSGTFAILPLFQFGLARELTPEIASWRWKRMELTFHNAQSRFWK